MEKEQEITRETDSGTSAENIPEERLNEVFDVKSAIEEQQGVKVRIYRSKRGFIIKAGEKPRRNIDRDFT